jgi:hypothetical protein
MMALSLMRTLSPGALQLPVGGRNIDCESGALLWRGQMAGTMCLYYLAPIVEIPILE